MSPLLEAVQRRCRHYVLREAILLVDHPLGKEVLPQRRLTACLVELERVASELWICGKAEHICQTVFVFIMCVFIHFA